MWARWDGPIYITLAQVSYHERERVPVTAFFPLYSFVMQLVTLFSSNRELLALAGVLISNLALVVALAYIVALGRLDFDLPTGRRCALLPGRPDYALPVRGVLCGSMTLLLLMSNHLASMPRYALTVFPVFFVLAQWGSDRRFHWLLVAVSFALALVAMARFSQWRWTA